MKINVIDRQGKKFEIDADPGLPLETVITQAGIESSFGICGGACACSSCQCYLAEENYAQVTPPEEVETAVLEDMAHELKPTSRLACQLEVTEQMEGWTFTIAPY
tara:strand:- start:965 stop:1279 length:315 start_codon:yes stop_codon:yes gene_type:complete